MTTHPSLDEIVAAIDGRLTPAERSDIDSHLAECAICRAEYVQVSLLAQSAPPAPASRRRWLRTAGFAAAAAVVFAVALPLTRRPRPEIRPADQRAVAKESTVAIVSPSPSATVSRDSVRFAWRGAAAARYRVIITDSAGAELYSSATSDTTLILPASVALHPGAHYYWFVDELRADGSSLSSQANSFSIRP